MEVKMSFLRLTELKKTELNKRADVQLLRY